MQRRQARTKDVAFADLTMERRKEFLIAIPQSTPRLRVLRPFDNALGKIRRAQRREDRG